MFVRFCSHKLLQSGVENSKTPAGCTDNAETPQGANPRRLGVRRGKRAVFHTTILTF